jgi:hypothetical protein
MAMTSATNARPTEPIPIQHTAHNGLLRDCSEMTNTPRLTRGEFVIAPQDAVSAPFWRTEVARPPSGADNRGKFARFSRGDHRPEFWSSGPAARTCPGIILAGMPSLFVWSIGRKERVGGHLCVAASARLPSKLPSPYLPSTPTCSTVSQSCEEVGACGSGGVCEWWCFWRPPRDMRFCRR